MCGTSAVSNMSTAFIENVDSGRGRRVAGENVLRVFCGAVACSDGFTRQCTSGVPVRVLLADHHPGSIPVPLFVPVRGVFSVTEFFLYETLSVVPHLLKHTTDQRQ